jgi:hypothetical protein
MTICGLLTSGRTGRKAMTAQLSSGLQKMGAGTAYLKQDAKESDQPCYLAHAFLRPDILAQQKAPAKRIEPGDAPRARAKTQAALGTSKEY